MAEAVEIAEATPAALARKQEWKLRWLRFREQAFFFALVLPGVILIMIFLLYPLFRMFSWSFGDASDIKLDTWDTLDQYDRAVTGKVYQILFRTTFIIAGLTTVIAVAIGYPIAYLLANVSDKARALLLPLVVIPFWTSILVRTFAWRIILGRRGFINETLDFLHMREFIGNILQVLDNIDPHWLNLIDPPDIDGEPLTLVFNRIGTLIGMVHIMTPFMIFPIFAVMRGIPNELVKAAENLGAGPFKAFQRVYFPLTLPGLGAGVLLTFILSLGFFITPALLGGPRDRMVSNMIESQINEVNNWEFAAALAFLLLGATIILYVIYARFMSFDKLYGEQK